MMREFCPPKIDRGLCAPVGQLQEPAFPAPRPQERRRGPWRERGFVYAMVAIWSLPGASSTHAPETFSAEGGGRGAAGEW